MTRLHAPCSILCLAIAVLALLSGYTAVAQEPPGEPRVITVLAGTPAVAAFASGSADTDIDTVEFERLLQDLFAAEFAAEQVRFVAGREIASGVHETVVSVFVRYRLVDTSLTVVLALVDEASNEALGGGVYSGFADLGLVRVVRQAVADTRTQLEQIVDRSPRPVRIPETLVELTLRSPHQRGALRFQDGGEPVFRTTVPFQLGTDITLLHSAPGFYSRTERVRIDAPVMRFDAPPLEPVIVREIVYSWTTNRPLGAGAGIRVYPIPRALFLEMGVHASSGYRFNASSQFTALVDLRLNTGAYILRSQDRRLAASVAPGAGVVVTTLPAADGTTTFADPYLVLASFAADVPFPRLAPFARLDLLYYAGGSGGFFLPGLFPYLSLGVRQAWTD